MAFQLLVLNSYFQVLYSSYLLFQSFLCLADVRFRNVSVLSILAFIAEEHADEHCNHGKEFVSFVRWILRESIKRASFISSSLSLQHSSKKYIEEKRRKMKSFALFALLLLASACVFGMYNKRVGYTLICCTASARVYNTRVIYTLPHC